MMQSHQSVLKGIGIINQKFISKTDFFYKLTAPIFIGAVTYNDPNLKASCPRLDERLLHDPISC